MNSGFFSSNPRLQIQLLLEIWQNLPRIYQREVIETLLRLQLDENNQELQFDSYTWTRLLPNRMDWDECQNELLDSLLDKCPVESKTQIVLELLNSLPHDRRMEILHTYFRVQPSQ